MLTVSGKKIVDKNGKKVRLTGISLGGWLMMEGYMLGGKNIPEHTFKQNLGSLSKEFTREFRQRFFTEKDAETIKNLGFNCVRIPFNYRLLEEGPGLSGGIEFLKEVVSWFTRRKLYVILDMHAVPGSQNKDWHSDSEGVAEFFEKEEHQKHFLKLWDQLSKTFKDEDYVAGYDVMNEAVTEKTDLLKQTYEDVIKVIRQNNDNHIIFLEGNMWGRNIDFIKDLFKDNVAISIHFYDPVRFVFNQFSNLTYPGKVNGEQWNKARIGKTLKEYSKYNVPVYVGEFGIASRCPECKAEYSWVRDVLKCFKDFGYHYTYWTYKSVGGMRCPDGLFQLFDHSGIIGQETEHPGMDNLLFKMKEDSEKVYDILDTKNFVLNKKLMGVIGNYLC